MSQFDWHSDTITQETQVTATYRHTQNVRRFLQIIVVLTLSLTGILWPGSKMLRPRRWAMWSGSGSVETQLKSHNLASLRQITRRKHSR